MTLTRPRKLRAILVAAGLTAVLWPAQLAAAGTSGSSTPVGTLLTGSLPPQNPFMAPGGVGSVHNDSESSNATPQPGPGAGSIGSTLAFSGTVCPTILLDGSGFVIAYCLENTSPFQPSLRLLDPKTLDVLASLTLPPTGPFGVYLYLDESGRAVLATGAGHILRVAHEQDAAGTWHMDVVGDWDISRQVLGHCGGSPLCDYVVSVKPDWLGRIWFATTGGVIGTLDPATGTARSVMLPAGEMVTKAISSSPAGVAVASDHALYFFVAPPGAAPYVVWRQAYERGSGVKTGQVADGTGTAPTFFGLLGDQYVTIIDNAVPQEHVLVYRVGPVPDGNRLVCAVPVFAAGASATENTSIGIGNSVIASNTAGYEFTNPTDPVPLPGGLTRIDVRGDGSGCDVVWANSVPSDAVPKLSASNGNVYTFDRTVSGSTAIYGFDAIDFETGQVVAQHDIGAGPAFETLQLPPMLAPDGTLYESTVAGIIRVTPATG